MLSVRRTISQSGARKHLCDTPPNTKLELIQGASIVVAGEFLSDHAREKLIMRPTRRRKKSTSNVVFCELRARNDRLHANVPALLNELRAPPLRRRPSNPFEEDHEEDHGGNFFTVVRTTGVCKTWGQTPFEEDQEAERSLDRRENNRA
jgi:hypothetical protein